MVLATIALALLLRVSQAPSCAVPERQPEPPTVEALLALPSAEFRCGLLGFRVPEGASAPDLAPLADRCWDEFPPRQETEPSEERSWYEARYACGRIVERLAEMASDPAPLVARLKDHEAGPLRQGLVDGLFTARIKKAIEHLSDLPPEPPEPASPKPSLARRLARAPRELQDAYLLRQGLAERERARRSAAEMDATSVFEHWEAFASSVDDVLTGRMDPERGAAELARYKWGGGCGNGAEALYGPQSRAALLADLTVGRRWSAAAHYPYLLGDDPGDDRGFRLARGLLGAVGVDWEQAFLGDVLAGNPHAVTNLARHASSRVAPLLVAIADLQPAEGDDEEDDNRDETWLWTALAAFVRPGDACEPSDDVGVPFRDPEAGFAAPAEESRILEGLGRHVAGGASLEEAESAAGLLAHACREESRPVLRDMLRSPYQAVREQGARTLQSMGESVPPVRPTPLVQFRLLVDGAPLREASVTYELEGSEGAWLRSSEATTDREGRLGLPGDPFRDPKQAVARVNLRVEGGPVDSLGATPRFVAHAYPPTSVSRPTDVSVTTQVLSIGCAPMSDGQGFVQLFAESPAPGRAGFLLSAREARLGAAPTRLRVARGRYGLMAFHPHSGVWSGDVEVGDAPVVVECGEFKSEEYAPPSEP